jgi:membrane protease subunit HflK
LLPGGGFGGGRGFALILIVLFIVWMASGLYRVQPDQQGVVLQFGKWVETTQPGLNWHLPYPIETVETPGVERIQAIDVGFRSIGGDRARAQRRDVSEESLMVTGDQNIIDIDFTVQWKIADAGKFLFNIRDQEATVKIAAESAMREIIGRTDIQPALTEARQAVEVKTRELLQSILNEYEAGIEITQVQLQEVLPPAPVIDAFDDVQRARQDRERLRNEADAYRNDILPRARGEAQRMIQEAQGYRERLENEADGEAQRFLQVLAAYKQNPDVTKRRMYLETMEGLLSEIDKVIMDRGVQGAVPYLPLNELRRKSGGAPGAGAQ